MGTDKKYIYTVSINTQQLYDGKTTAYYRIWSFKEQSYSSFADYIPINVPSQCRYESEHAVRMKVDCREDITFEL